MKQNERDLKKQKYDLALKEITGLSNQDADEVGSVLRAINSANKKGLKLLRTQLKVYLRFIDLLLKK